ncbi:hypothetical protein HD806DRAFT_179367 [Xylariaceae sp. AK1471]|nr:hypothetical protein HD806DRAFT_179367 [Xylariaceae sp. AK1471]
MRFLVISLLITLSSQQEFNAHRQSTPPRDGRSYQLHAPYSVHDDGNSSTITNAGSLHGTAPMIIPTIPGNRTFTPTPSPSPRCELTYVVRERDTCEKLCIYQELSLVELIKLNPKLYVEKDGQCPLTVGETLCVMGGGDSITITSTIEYSSTSKYSTSSTSVVEILPTTTAFPLSSTFSTHQPSESFTLTADVTSSTSEDITPPTTTSISTVRSSSLATATSSPSSSSPPNAQSSTLESSTVASTTSRDSLASSTTTSSMGLLSVFWPWPLLTSSTTTTLVSSELVSSPSDSTITVVTTSSKFQSSSSSSDSTMPSSSKPSPPPLDSPTGVDVIPTTRNKPSPSPSDSPTGVDVVPVIKPSPTGANVVPVKPLSKKASSGTSQTGAARAENVESRETEGNERGLWGWLPTTFQTSTRGSGEDD